jgi:hypothetical protein
MWTPIGKVIGPPSLLHTTRDFVDHILHICVALTVKLEAANKALTEERATRQVPNQILWASLETCSVLTWDLQCVRASADILKDEFSAKSVALDELVVREREA